MAFIPLGISSPLDSCTICTSFSKTNIPSDGCTSAGARPSPYRKLPVSASRATAYKPWIASPPTGAHSSSPTGTACTTTAKLSISTSSTLSSAAYINKKIMSKIKIKVTINMEHMSHDEQMRYFIRLADMDLLPPCPPEIRRKYEKSTDK